jgi:SET domain
MLLKKWNSLRIRHESETSKVLWQDIIETFAWESPFKDTSRLFFSLPKTWHDMKHVLRKGLMEFRREKATRSLKWLEHHGICADNFRAGLSDIPQAGRGAFATRSLGVNSIVAPLPMIHIPYRERLSMYLPGSKDDEKIGQQLILNYCFGHRESTMLLCPYGPFSSFINHGSEPNVKMRWSDPIRSSHSPEWLNKSVDEFTTQEGAVLTMELVAIRNIEKNEEILLDYGDEWEKAWNQHVENWVPVAGADSYVSAEEINLDMKSRLKTVFEQIEHPYPSNLELFFDLAFRNRWDWIHHWKKGRLSTYRMNAGQLLARCDILKSNIGNDGRFSYDAIYTDPQTQEENEVNIRVTDVPREAFVFKDKPYTADFLQKNVFRHDIRIPDSIFPEAWKNHR